MNRKAIVYCHYNVKNSYNSFSFTFKALQRLSYLSEHSEDFSDFDIIFIQDKESESMLNEMLKIENIDLSRVNYVSKTFFDEYSGQKNKSFFMFLRFIELSNAKYDMIWFKDLDHFLDKNDLKWFQIFENSPCVLATVPNCSNLKYLSCGDMGVKTKNFRNIFDEKFKNNVFKFIEAHHDSIQYYFDLYALNQYLFRFFGEDLLSQKEKVIVFIIDDWRKRNIVAKNGDYSALNYVEVEYVHEAPRISYKKYDHKNRTYELNGNNLKTLVEEDYRDLQRQTTTEINYFDLTKKFLEMFK